MLCCVTSGYPLMFYHYYDYVVGVSLQFILEGFIKSIALSYRTLLSVDGNVMRVRGEENDC